MIPRWLPVFLTVRVTCSVTNGMRENSRETILLATVTVATIGVGPVSAALPVIDMTAIQNLITEINWLKQQYTELQSVYSSLAHPTAVLGMAPELFGQQNPLPAVGTMTGIISGTGGGGTLGGLINQINSRTGLTGRTAVTGRRSGSTAPPIPTLACRRLPKPCFRAFNKE